MPEPLSGEAAARSARRAAARRRVVVRRRRAALALLAVGAALAGALAGRDDEVSDTTVATPAAAAPECPSPLGASPATLAGQRLVVRLDARPSAQLLNRARRGTIAGVVLFPPTGTEPEEVRRWVDELDRSAARGGMPEPLALIDQEGGEVERLPELPPRVAPASIEAEAAALEEGRRTGSALAAIGVDVDLAPVLDVPASSDAFIASRAFAGGPRAAAAFAGGLASGGVAATAKHFPGLGSAYVNTDDAPSAVDASRRALDRELEAFSSAIDAGVELVMVANATYPALDPRHPASLSRRVTTGLLREELGFDGVVITDDLGAGAITGAGVDEAGAAVGAARAGADLLLFALSDGRAAQRALARALRRGELPRGAALAACARVAALR